MSRRESDTLKIARLTSKRFPSLSTAGTNVGELVRFILAKRSALKKAQRPKIDDDFRDYINTSYFLSPLSTKALNEIKNMSRGDIRHHLKGKIYPFSRLSRKTRESLLHLPNSWVQGAANWLLPDRRQSEIVSSD